MVREQQVAWPYQVPVTLGGLLPKKGGGDRAIGLLTTFARIWSLTREPVAGDWSGATSAHWGAAAQGNASLRE
eukprot:5941592-Pyramimonas_sp.AAC.1